MQIIQLPRLNRDEYNQLQKTSTQTKCPVLAKLINKAERTNCHPDILPMHGNKRLGTLCTSIDDLAIIVWAFREYCAEAEAFAAESADSNEDSGLTDYEIQSLRRLRPLIAHMVVEG